MLQPGFDPNRWIGSLGRQSLEIHLRNLLVEENALVGHTHRKCDREVRVNDSKVPRRGGDSGLTTGVNVVHARKFRRGAYCNPEVDATKLANRSEEFPILGLPGVVCGTRAQKFVAGAVPASAAVVHRRIPLLEPDEQDEVHLLSRVGVAEKDRVLEFGPSRSEPFSEAMKRFLVLDDRCLDERLGSFKEELPSALRSGHCTDGAHLRNVFYDFRKHLVLIHHSQLHMSVVLKYSRSVGGR